MEPNDLAIRMTGVRKQYRLGAISARTLQADLQSWWAKKRGQEDPNQRLDVNTGQIGQRFWALDGINLSVRRGERLGIIGVNGAGKSTLLKLISRVTAPTEGEIDIWGRVSSILEVGTGFHGEMTGRENIYMNGAILGMTRAEIDAQMENIIDFSEIREFIDTPIKRYSSGMFVKLAFSVAAHLKNEIMIMDEVLAVGDMAFQQKCLERMRQAADDEGRTILYVSHHMHTIRALCERCIVLEQGRIIFDGEPEPAIGVYMNRSLSSNELDMDLTAIPHQAPKSDQTVRMTHLLLTEKDAPIYEPGQPLRMCLTLHAEQPAAQLCIRVTLRSVADVGLGTAWSKPFDIDSPGDHTVCLELPLEQLSKGVFYASLGVYTRDELGRPRSLDHITRAFRFELPGLPIWNTNAHGYFALPQMNITGLHRKESS